MCYSKKNLYQYFVVFYPVWDSFFSENLLYVIKYHKKIEENINHPWLFKLGKWSNRYPV